MTKPRILSTSILAESQLFRIETIDLGFSNGDKATFECVRTQGNGVAMVAVITAERELLMVREYAACADRYELGFVKGKIDPGESALDTASRELIEEVGYRAQKISLLRTVTMSPAYNDLITHLFIASELSPGEATGDEIEPLEQFRWPLDQIDGLFGHPEVTDARVLMLLGLIERNRANLNDYPQ